MAVVPPEIKAFGTGDYAGYRIIWAGMKSGDVGQPVVYPHFANKTISVDGDTVVKAGLQGSNFEDELHFHEILGDDGLGDQDLITRRGFFRLTINPYRIRPYVTDGENVTVVLVVTH
jgi:hypothetical protein